MRKLAVVWVLVGLVALVTAGCRVTVPAPVEEPDVEAGEIDDPDPGDELTVGLDVVEGPGGGTLAFVPVTIAGQGPYAFALDTGASHSVVDQAIADELGLEEVGTAQQVTGVIGGGQARQVQVDDWRIQDVDLGTRPVVALDLSGPEEDVGIQGLLGSDVLSEFGAIVVDYDNRSLILRPRQGGD